MDAALTFAELPPGHPQDSFLSVVVRGLSAPRKQLPCRFFYDSGGSQLFERICQLPEYYLTRTEQAILEEYAPAMVAAAGDELAMVEFGSGSSCKTRILMNATLARQPRLHYIPIDISADFLRASAVNLLEEYDRLTITAIAAEYNDGVRALPRHDGPRLILFLGSNIGNFEQEAAIAFLMRVRRQMMPQDRILIGVDLVKDRKILENAYNDSLGITEAFNKNLLRRINAEIGGEFDLEAFAHHAPFVETESRIEMHLVSRRRQEVAVDAAGRKFAFEQGETIHTENSHKYTISQFAAICARARLSIQRRWQDKDAWFAVLLLKPEPA